MQTRRNLAVLTAFVVAGIPSAAGPATADDRTHPAATQAGVLFAETRDDRGAVHLARRSGLSGRDRRTMDIHRVRVIDLGAKVRFEIQWRDIRRLSRYVDQMAFVEMRPAWDSPDRWSAQAGLSPQMPRFGYAYWFADDSGTRYRACDPVRSRARHASATVSIDVPNRLSAREADQDHGKDLHMFFPRQ